MKMTTKKHRNNISDVSSQFTALSSIKQIDSGMKGKMIKGKLFLEDSSSDIQLSGLKKKGPLQKESFAENKQLTPVP